LAKRKRKNLAFAAASCGIFCWSFVLSHPPTFWRNEKEKNLEFAVASCGIFFWSFLLSYPLAVTFRATNFLAKRKRKNLAFAVASCGIFLLVISFTLSFAAKVDGVL